MKKVIVLLSVFIVLFCLTSCPNPNTPRKKETTQKTQTQKTTQETQASKTKQETQAPTIHTSREKSTEQNLSKKKQETQKPKKEKREEPQTPEEEKEIQKRKIYTGPRGGQYYYNEKGKKVYIKKKKR